MGAKTAFVGMGEPTYEDGKQACIIEIPGLTTKAGDCEWGTFVRFQSWDTSKAHLEMHPFLNRKLLITIEVID